VLLCTWNHLPLPVSNEAVSQASGVTYKPLQRPAQSFLTQRLRSPSLLWSLPSHAYTRSPSLSHLGYIGVAPAAGTGGRVSETPVMEPQTPKIVTPVQPDEADPTGHQHTESRFEQEPGNNYRCPGGRGCFLNSFLSPPTLPFVAVADRAEVQALSADVATLELDFK
jgi:hypothetical protein